LEIFSIKRFTDGYLSESCPLEHFGVFSSGSLFLGKYSAEAFGDYCTGTNHVLPTNGGARFTSGLSVRDFVKLQTYQKLDKRSAIKLAPIALKLSRIEGLDAHKKSIVVRIKK